MSRTSMYYVSKYPGLPRQGPYTFAQLRLMWDSGEINASSVVYPDTEGMRDDISYGFNPNGTTGDALVACMERRNQPSGPKSEYFLPASDPAPRAYDLATIRMQTQFAGLRNCAVALKVCAGLFLVLTIVLTAFTWSLVPVAAMEGIVSAGTFISGVASSGGMYATALIFVGFADHLDMMLLQLNKPRG